jgi:hypothetical protein
MIIRFIETSSRMPGWTQRSDAFGRFTRCERRAILGLGTNSVCAGEEGPVKEQTEAMAHSPPSGGSPKLREKRVRWETVAAIASAIGALASATVAIPALLLAKHQEDIAKDQVRATYLSNLYSKQVDAVASLENSISTFQVYAAEHGLFCDRPVSGKVFKKIQPDAVREYSRLLENIGQSQSVLSFTVVPPFAAYVAVPYALMSDLVQKSTDFVAKNGNDDGYNKLCNNNQVDLRELDNWRLKFSQCVQPIFVEGSNLTEDRLRVCNPEVGGVYLFPKPEAKK